MHVIIMYSFKSVLLGGTVAVLALSGTLSTGINEAAAQQISAGNPTYARVTTTECAPFDIACLLRRPTASIATTSTASQDNGGSDRDGFTGAGFAGSFGGPGGNGNNNGGGDNGGGNQGGGNGR